MATTTTATATTFPPQLCKSCPYSSIALTCPLQWHRTDCWQEELGGLWYLAMSTDGCNASKAVPCAAGGRLDLYSASALEGPWTQLLVDEGGMFTTNTTVRPP